MLSETVISPFVQLDDNSAAHLAQLFAALGDPALAVAQKERAALGNAPDPVQCRKTCDELQAKGELAVPVAECVQKLCAD